MRNEMKSLVAIALLAKPSLTSPTTARSVGVSDPTGGWPLAFAAAAPGVGNSILGRQRRTLDPGGIELIVAERFTQ